MDAWVAVLPAVLAETRALRAALHRAAGSGRCDLRTTGMPPGDGPVRIDGDCACRDFLVDMAVEAYVLLVAHDGELRNPPGAVRTHLRTRAIGDWIRRRRTEMGAQARCDRIRHGARARALPDEYHRAVLEFLVDEAGSPAPLDGHEDLVLRLAVRCAAEFGSALGDGAADHRDRVATILPTVERVCRTGPRVNVGTDDAPEFVTWWERFVERPLGRRPRRSLSPLPDEHEAETSVLDRVLAHDAPTRADEQVLDGLVTALRRCPDAPETALRNGLAELVAHGVLPPGTADSVLRDRSRMTAAARELSTLA